MSQQPAKNACVCPASATRLGECAVTISPRMHCDVVPRPCAYPWECVRAHCACGRIFSVVMYAHFAYVLFFTRAHTPHTFYTRTGRSGPPRRAAAGRAAPAGPASPARTARYRSDSHRRRQQWRRQQQLCTLHARTHIHALMLRRDPTGEYGVRTSTTTSFYTPSDCLPKGLIAG